MTWFLVMLLGTVTIAVGFVLGRIELNLPDPSDPSRYKAKFNGGSQRMTW